MKNYFRMLMVRWPKYLLCYIQGQVFCFIFFLNVRKKIPNPTSSQSPNRVLLSLSQSLPAFENLPTVPPE